MNAHANVFMPEKKRRQRDGYAEGDYTLHNTASAREFVSCSDPVAFLGTVNRIAFRTEEEKRCAFWIVPYASNLYSSLRWASLDVTTQDVLANCDDLKVLGKGDFKALLKWRSSMREEVLCTLFPASTIIELISSSLSPLSIAWS